MLAQLDTVLQVIVQARPYFTFDRGDKRYEISNHLGNVLAVVSDRKIAVTSPADSWLFEQYRADLWSVSDCQPFGMAVPERSWAAEDYRFGFNGKENDGEWDAQDYGGRIYMPKQARWISPDPLAELRAWLSAYNFVQNNPIGRIDPDGMLDGWVGVNKDGKHVIGWDDRVTDQASAESIYGKGAKYYEVGTSGVEMYGYAYVLGDNGSITLTSSGRTFNGYNWTPPAISRLETVEHSIVSNIGRSLESVAHSNWGQAIGDAVEAGGHEVAKFALRSSPLIFWADLYSTSTTNHDIFGEKLTTTELLGSLGVTPGRVRGGAKSIPQYVVYEGIDRSTGLTRYVGITSRNPAIRFQEHLRSKTLRSGLDYQVKTNYGKLSKIDARIIEQKMINMYGLSGKNGQLLNKNNSIHPRFWKRYGIR